MNMESNRIISRMNARELSIEEAAGVAAGTLRTLRTAGIAGSVDVLTTED